jgi:TolB protein
LAYACRWRRPNDSKAQQVTNKDLEDWFPHPSPDGKHLLVFSFK